MNPTSKPFYLSKRFWVLIIMFIYNLICFFIPSAANVVPQETINQALTGIFMFVAMVSKDKITLGD